MPKDQLSKQIIEAALYLKKQRLTPGATGNVSVRFSAVTGGQSKAPTKDQTVGGGEEAPQINGMLITPTGMSYESLTPGDIVFVSDEGTWDESGRRPSSEWQFHLAAYKANKGVHALVHTHSNYATTLACAELEIPPFHYMVAAAGGSTIPLVPYAIFGSRELSDGVAKAFENNTACLMAHHGLLAGERDLDKAIELTEIIEDLSQQYWAVRQLGEPKLLSDEQMQKVLAKFQTYGQQ